MSGNLSHQLAVEEVVLRVLTRDRHDLAVGELARSLLDQLLFIGKVEVHRSTLSVWDRCPAPAWSYYLTSW